MMDHRVSVSASSISRALGLTAVVLVLLSIAGQLVLQVTDHRVAWVYARLMNVDAERNIPTAFSILCLLFSALLLGVTAALSWRRGDGRAAYWALLSLGFVCMAIDEGWWVHEMLDVHMRQRLGDSNRGIFYFAWVGPGVVLVAVLGLIFARFLWRLPAGTRRALLQAGGLYLCGAIGMEMVGGQHAEAHGMSGLVYVLMATTEEALEMAGIIVLIRALLTYLAEQHGAVRLQFVAAGGKSKGTRAERSETDDDELAETALAGRD